MSVELKTIASGYSTGLINENFQQLADLLNNNFLNRDGLDEGDPNQMELDLDMNGNAILNFEVGTDPGSLVNKAYVDAGDLANTENWADEVQARKDADDSIRDDFSSADANIQSQLTGEVPLEASAFSPISWHDQTVDNSVTIPDEKNAWSFGPTMSVSSGVVVEVGTDSFWTIAEGQNDQFAVDISNLENRTTDIESVLSQLGTFEAVVLSDLQTIVELQTLNTNNISVYIEGVRDFEFTVDNGTTLTLSQSFPAGTILWVTKS